MAKEKIATGENVNKTSAMRALVASRRYSRLATERLKYGRITEAREAAQMAVTEAVVAAEIIRSIK